MSDESRDERSPFNVWWAVAGGFLAAVVIALVAVLVLGHGNKTNDANRGGGGTTQTVPPASSPSTSNTTSGCDLPAGSQSIPTSAPPTKWTTDIYLVVPSSSTYGPEKRPGSRWGCFAHSPTGALFAAAQAVAGAGNADYKSFMSAAAVQNPALTDWIAAQVPSEHTQTAGHVGQFSGFQFVSVQNNAVVINLAFTDETVTGYMKVSLVWDSSADTWKVDLATSNLVFQTADPSAYTTWAASDGK